MSRRLRPSSKAELSRAFSQAAGQYDRQVSFQLQCVKEFREFIRENCAIKAPKRIFEAGCGTGNMTMELLHLWSDARIMATDLAPGMVEESARRFREYPNVQCSCRDFDEPLGLAPEWDLAVSSLGLQWSSHLPQALDNLLGCLRPGGELLAALPVAGSLEALQQAFRQAGGEFPGQPLPDYEEVQQLVQQRCSECVFQLREYGECYPSLLEFLRTMQRNGTSGGWRGCEPALLRRVLQQNAAGEFTVGYRVLFLRGVRP